MTWWLYLCPDSINPPGPISFSGHVVGELAMKKTEDIGSLLLFTFQVCLKSDWLLKLNRPGVTHNLLQQAHVDGKLLGGLGNLQVEFHWPSEVSNGKWLLYLTEIQVNGTSESRCNPPNNIINPLNLRVTMATAHSFQNKTPVVGLFRIKKKFNQRLLCLKLNCLMFVSQNKSFIWLYFNILFHTSQHTTIT